MLGSHASGSLDHMFAHWKAVAVAAVVAVAVGMIAGLAFAGGPEEPTVGDPVVLTPTPSQSPWIPSPDPRATQRPSDDDRGDDDRPDDRDDDDRDDLREVERTPQPWHDDDDDRDDDDRDDGADDDDRDDDGGDGDD
jgi:hypothetical protein